jgi:hypothetical protein
MGVISAPLGIVRVNGYVIGKMKNININENINRATVQGLGELTPQEFPAVAWAGTLSCSFYVIDWNTASLPGAIERNVNTLKQFTDSVLLQSEGVTVDLYKKVPAPGQPTIGLINGQETPFAIVAGLFLESDQFDMAEGSVGNKNQSFRYLFPIINPS